MSEYKKPSLSIFFPCYNDKGTIATLILEAKKVAEKLTDDFEVIVIDDGSTDGARELLMDFKLRNEVPQFKLVMHEKNRGYGGAIRSGFATATKDLVFYTDGDGQYDVRELPLLWEKMTPEVDVVNGYKIKRHDPLHRIIVGLIYQYSVRLAFWLPIRDIDCDFRLIRRSLLEKVEFRSNSGTITIEQIKKLQQAGARFVEVGVSHLYRRYGSSQFFTFRRVATTLWRLMFMWVDLMVLQKLTRPEVSIVLRKIIELNFRKQKEAIKEHLSVKEGEKVLDLGCGTGEFSPLFPKESYTGIDLDPKNIAYAKAHYDKVFCEADGRALPFPDATFDKILVVGVLHHISDTDTDKVFSEMKRVLKPRGVMLIMEDTVSTRAITKLMHKADQGAHIRRSDEWKRLLEKHVKVAKTWTFNNGVCFYSAFVTAPK